MMRPGGRLLLLTGLLCLSLGCEPPPRSSTSSASWSNRTSNSCLNIDEVLPDGWEYLNTYRLDPNRDGKLEWIIVYRFDLAEKKASSGPMGAIIYQPDEESPPNIRAHNLRPPDGDYLCECNCVFEMKSVLSGHEGDELVIKDRCNEEISRLTIFQWASDAKAYVPRGHFIDDRIEIDQDVVTTTERVESRAQLVMVKTYHPDAGKTYYQSDSQTPMPYTREALDFCHGVPKDVCCSPYPEKVVLAFYKDYKNDEKASTYFSDSARQRTGSCDARECGCTARRYEIDRVRVLKLDPGPDDTQDQDRATVDAWIVCDLKSGMTGESNHVRWDLVREDGRWRLDGPAQYPPTP